MITRTRSAFVVTIASGLALLVGSGAKAGLVVDDFTYPARALMTLEGGSGWIGPWGASTGEGSVTGRIYINSTNNLAYSQGGYNVAQTGSGAAYGDFTEFRGINRLIDVDLQGTVWFSILINNGDVGSHAGLQFNNHADGTFGGIDYGAGAFHVEVFGTSVQARYGGAQSGSLATLSLGSTHLLLGRITIGAGNDRLELWANPADLLNLGTPLFDNNSANIGENLYMAGIFSYGPSGTRGNLDALRISDGNGNATQAFQDVTGVPEPSSAILLLAGGMLLGGIRRSSHRSRR